MAKKEIETLEKVDKKVEKDTLVLVEVSTSKVILGKQYFAGSKYFVKKSIKNLFNI